ncbi:serine/threonine-protein kinase [Microbacterium immunditiarum]|uniref:Serine/threonine protein kinase n=1 Tax=Microbacterium immunditiarum TaxID=337480 RepID=A0A7Y9GN30_9MICO|nr:serine/threonine-protein kinase [Microbacterium immunditiarum]NYE19517.1 serine/threonine protein kinase [Microbacterium immunditiarum]
MTDVREISGPATGELLGGRYRLEECIGVGGMARVYRAEDTLLHRTVAIKMLQGPFSEPGGQERAEAETSALATLNHHSLVTLFDAHVSRDDVSFLVMEHVEGRTLRDLIADGPVDQDELAAIAVDIAEGLHLAHAAGIVHRDIKPSNILLCESPLPGHPWRAKVADFGIAYLLDSARMTNPGIVIGTIAYIAPEQARGAAPAPPADIYAFGIMLLEAMTGRRPFGEAEGFGAVTARLVRSPEIPEHLDETWKCLLRGMTASRPEDRPTALEVAATLAGQAAVARSRADTVTVSTEPLTIPAEWMREEPVTPKPIAAVPERTDAATAVYPSAYPIEDRDHPAPPRRRRTRGVFVAIVAAAALLTAAIVMVMWLPGLGAAAPFTDRSPNPAYTSEVEPQDSVAEETVDEAPVEQQTVDQGVVDQRGDPAPAEQGSINQRPIEQRQAEQGPADNAPAEPVGVSGTSEGSSSGGGNPNSGPGDNGANGDRSDSNSGSGNGRGGNE